MKVRSLLISPKRWLAAILILILPPLVSAIVTADTIDPQLTEGAKLGDLTLVKSLLDNGADVNAKTNEGCTALMWAIMSGQVEIVKLLLDKGADVNAKAEDGSSALMWAAAMDREDAVKLLRAYGAKMSLPIAALIGDTLEAIEHLEAGAAVNVKDRHGWTPLMNAAQKGHADMIKLLLERGADPSAKRQDGSTALDDAFGSGKVDVVKAFLDTNPAFLQRITAGTVGALRRACYWGQTEIVNLLLDRGIDVNGKDADGSTALMSASRGGQLKVVRLLLNRGADVNEKNVDDGTALMDACFGGQLEVVKLLLDRGADVNAKSRWKTTALNIARGPIKELLLDRGAKKGIDPNSPDWPKMQEGE